MQIVEGKASITVRAAVPNAAGIVPLAVPSPHRQSIVLNGTQIVRVVSSSKGRPPRQGLHASQRLRISLDRNKVDDWGSITAARHHRLSERSYGGLNSGTM